MHFCERRIFRDVVRSEHDELAQILRDLVAVRLLLEETLPALFIDVLELFLPVNSRARFTQRLGVNICRENLHVVLAAPVG